MKKSQRVALHESAQDSHRENQLNPKGNVDVKKSFHFLHDKIYEESSAINCEFYNLLLMLIVEKNPSFQQAMMTESNNDAKGFFSEANKGPLIKKLFGQVVRADVSQTLSAKLQEFVGEIGCDQSVVDDDFVKEVASDFFKEAPKMHDKILLEEREKESDKLNLGQGDRKSLKKLISLQKKEMGMKSEESPKTVIHGAKLSVTSEENRSR